LGSEILLNASIGNGVARGGGGTTTATPGRENEYFKREKNVIFCAQQIFK